jgi:hypothetical protein
MRVGHLEIPDEEITNIKFDYANQMTVNALTKKYKRGHHTILRVLGKEPRPVKLRPGERQKIIKARKAGAQVREIMENFKRSHAVVSRVLSEEGLMDPPSPPQTEAALDASVRLAHAAIVQANKPPLADHLTRVLAALRAEYPEVTTVSMNPATGRIDVECVSKVTIKA